MTQPSGKVKRIQTAPLTENDRLLVLELAERWQCSDSRVVAIALHDWLKREFKSYD